MAQKTIVTLVSDLSGKEIADGGQTVEFGLDGVTYEIDLDETEANELRDQLAVFVEHGRRTGGRRSSSANRAASSSRSAAAPRTSSGSSAAEREENKRIRAWAKEHGYTVSDRGRIPSEVADAYRAA